MAWRYRRSVKVLPGVRLNFSKRGVSTTVGVRGASVNFGKRGTYLNTGIPGTGLYNRQRIADAHARSSAPKIASAASVRKYKHHLWPWWIFGTLIVAMTRQPALIWLYWGVLTVVWIIRSARGTASKHVDAALPETGVPLFLGPIETDKEITEEEIAAQLRRNYRQYLELEQRRLTAEHREKLARAHQEKLQKGFLSRRFASKRITSLAELIQATEQEEKNLAEAISALTIDADGPISDDVKGMYQLLSDSFAALIPSKAVWFVSSEASTDLSLKSSASTSYDRRRLTLATEQLPLLHSTFPGIAFDAPDKKLHISPAFVLIVHADHPFELKTLADLKIDFTPTRFVEEDQKPEDAKVVDQTWKKVNKDGSPDRRFSGNYQIPVMAYGELSIRSGVDTFKYLISNKETAADFAMKLVTYKAFVLPNSLGGTPIEDIAARTLESNTQSA